ncbi:hypothetical protein K6V98_03805 [Collinsella sp. AGMB00827]|uniref:Uncharacterized protein n=1 Tax=Collinsella ureilytica TaxID=2869515 RepID=A0ABS7MK77_9ACTN|nr:hypothetical protein [Collinsella urealyticum]MBY4797481.1 hypothetical protein [Collinsella urealyticum]
MELSFFILAAILFLFALFLGFTIGTSVGERSVTKADYWKMNAVGIGCAVLAGVLISGLPLLLYALVGLLGGYIGGLKMGFGETTGPWRVHDRVFNVNRSHRELAQRGGGEARRKRKRSGAAPQALISVAPGSANSQNQYSEKKNER